MEYEPTRVTVVLPEPVGEPDTGAGVDDASQIRAGLARELHDRVAQTLTTMVVEMENFKAYQYGRESVIREIASYQDSTRDVLSNIRKMLFELRDEATSIEFVANLRRRLRHYETRYGITASLRVSANWPRHLAAQAATHLFGIVDEALSNARRHGGASKVRVSLTMAEGQIAVMTVSDNGSGLEVAWGERDGWGLIGMRERALLLGGELQVLPTTPRGTMLKAAFPKERLI